VTVVPRDASGTLDPPGRDVDLFLGRAVPVGAVAEIGDGRYVATVRGLGGGPLVVRADVDGTTRAQAQIDETPAVDPAKTVARLQPGWVDAADLAGAETVVELSPRDGRGALTPDIEGLDIRLLDPSDGEILVDDRADREIGIFLTLPAQRLADEGPARVEIDGVVLDRVLEMSTWSDADEMRAAIDPARSHAAPFHQTAYADGEDFSDLAIELRDSDGDLLPLGPLVDYASDQMTFVSAATRHDGLQATVRMRTGLVDGQGLVDVLVDGEPTGVQAQIGLLPAIDHDLQAIDVEMCLDETQTPADGVGRIRAEIRPRWEDDGTLVGSNVPLTLSADGVGIPLEYVKPSTYEGWIDVPAEAGTTTVTVSMPGTADTADLWIEFYVLGEYEDHGLPSCTSTGDPAEYPDAGPGDGGLDAGPDGGDADADTDADADDDADTDSDTDRDAGAPAIGAPHFDPRGGGCTCSAAGI